MVKAQKILEAQLQCANVEESSVLQTSKSLEGTKLLYILVQDDPGSGVNEGEQGPSHRYTRPLLTSTLQLMGCKPRHAIKISNRVFEVIRSEMPPKQPKRDRFLGLAPLADIDKKDSKEHDSNGFKVNPKPLKKRSTVTVSREKFLNVVCEGLSQYQYLGPKQRTDLMVACRIRERKTSVTVLLCGTSGCGKSTLASLLGHRLGVTTVVSTDSVRHMMRGFVSEEENPLLWSSTYHAGEFLDPEAVSEAIRKKKVQMRTPSTGSSTPIDSSSLVDLESKLAICNGDGSFNNGNGSSSNGNGKGLQADEYPSLRPSGSGKLENGECLVSAKVMAVQGFKAQSEMVMDSLDRLITGWEKRRESVVVEGVHLSLNFVMGLMKKHPSIIPFMIYIANESKHMERFAVRAKYMTLDPSKNKYVKYIRNIRTIQDYLCKRADKHLVPKINNTNVDKSVAAIHATVFNCLRRMGDGEGLLDLNTNTVKVVHQEYTKQYTASALGSKSMFQLIQRKGSSRNLLAIMNDDGSIDKAWPVESAKKSEASVVEHKTFGTTLYGPLSVGSAEPVRLQFGNLGLSAWQSDNGTSSEVTISGANPHAGEGDPRNGDLRSAAASSSGIGPDKELKEEIEVNGSDEELEEEDEAAEREGETSGSELERVEQDEMEGSVDDGSGRSEGEDDIVAREEDDAYWEVEDSSPVPRSSPPIILKDKKAHMLRLRSFDKVAAARGAPVLRRANSHNVRSSSKKHSPKRYSPKRHSPKSIIQAAIASASP
ncbi:P-loop NTPase domain-containing protein LPA1 homolog 1 [Physcomitrium patens]|uniref:Uncharacterized protein n=1 Tax=Physcomitrium patens TaxID=3218 RepID=A0A2K1J8J9_PHYPA|nr:P-loop NTPase domain-containing protein LPA1 homolog 2-like [Physcomitrium patens]XP_024399209.1 P-loop NTPase domain-containing protein LPA1 homolog 2-like [Physcomitrium patens]PNR37855.1 hypothetical protein PHYPA_020964 [Physcomitrium patens]|eukprot:XP_024399208.1 P-loop NTPase domain-containing protein LPA1 homolog 2-like [Physcomitrella patens]